MERFDPKMIEISAGTYRENLTFASEGAAWTHYGSFAMVAGEPPVNKRKYPCSFQVYLPANEDGVPAPLMDVLTEVIGQITRMDARARLPLGDEQFEEDYDLDRDNELVYVHLEQNSVMLRYHCTRWNNEWGAIFERDQNGDWTYTNATG